MATQLTTTPVPSTYGDVFREVTTSAKQLIQSEVQLFKVEIKDVTENLTNQLSQAIFFGALVIVSAVPLLASAVISLGQYWDGNYALSALVVGLVCATFGGIFAYRALNRLSEMDMMPATKASLSEGAQSVGRKAEQISDAVTGDKL